MDELEFIPISWIDLEWARQLHNDAEVLHVLTDPHEVSEEEQKGWFLRLQKTERSERLVVLRGNERIGIIRLDQIDRTNASVRVGLDIHKDFRGKGLAKLIYKKLLSNLFVEFNRLWLLVASYNYRAINLYKGLGFKEEGVQRSALFRDGEYHDQVMMSILEEEYDDSAL